MKPDIFEIFRTFSRYLGKNSEIFREKKSAISGNIFRRFFVIFVSRPSLSSIYIRRLFLNPSYMFCTYVVSITPVSFPNNKKQNKNKNKTKKKKKNSSASVFNS